MRKFLLLLIIPLIMGAGCTLDQRVNTLESAKESAKEVAQQQEQKTSIKPIAEFEQRISKKSFGTYVTPQNSPVQPERFIGYHTGVDVEYDDKPDEKIPVYAIADGRVIHSAWVGGYGGVVIIRHPEYTALYGHLDPDSLIKKDTELVLGQEIGFLGQGYTNQTDNERKHLHLSIYTANVLNLKGYVQTKEELNKWIDPLKLK